MKTTTFRKLLCMFCLLLSTSGLMAASATVLFERNSNWDADTDLALWTETEEDGAVAIADGVLNFSGGNSGYAFKMAVSPSAGSTISYKANWAVGSSTGRAGGYNYMTIGGIQLRAYGQDGYASIVVDGTETTFEGSGKDDVRGGVWDVEFSIDQTTGEYSYTINMSSSGKYTGSGTTSAAFDGVTMGYYKPGRIVSTNQSLNSLYIAEIPVGVTTTLVERGYETDWSDADLALWPDPEPYNGASRATLSIVDNALNFSASNTSYENDLAVTTSANTIVNLKANWAVGTSTGRARGYNYMRIGGIELRAYGQDSYATIVVDGTETTITDSNKEDVRDGVWDIDLSINQATGEVTYTITMNSSGTHTGTATSTTAIDKLAIGYYKPGRVTALSQTLNKVWITETTQSVQTANYTLSYQTAEGTEVKSETRKGVVGKAITLQEADIEAFIVNGVKYLYVSDNSADLTIAADGTTKVIITVAEAEKKEYTLKAVDDEGNEITTLNEGIIYEGETAFHYYTKALKSNGTWYMVEKNAAIPYYGITIQYGENPTLAYAKTDVAYFTEAEVLTPSGSWAANGIVPDRYANGVAKRLSASSYVKTAALAGGTYTVTLSARNNSSSQTGNLPLYLVDAEGNIAEAALEQAFEDWSTAEQAEKSVSGVVIPDGYSLALYNATEYNSNLELDYIYLVKESSTVSFAISDESGYATYYNSTDAFIMPEGVEGGTVSGITDYSDNIKKVNITYSYTAGTVVPAGTPLILKGEVKEYEAEATTTTETAPESEYLFGYDNNSGIVEESSESYYYYKLCHSTVDGQDVVGFFWFAEGGHTNGSKPGKAYLRLPVSMFSNVNGVIFEEETDGINDINVEPAENADVFTISGMKVSGSDQPKGIYIVNGKKIVVK